VWRSLHVSSTQQKKGRTFASNGGGEASVIYRSERGRIAGCRRHLGPLSIALSLSASLVRRDPLPIDPKGPVRPLGGMGRRSRMRPSGGTYITLAAN